MNSEKETIFTEDTISLILDDNKEVECDILAIFEVKEQFYIALIPQTPIEGYEAGEYFLYRYQSDGKNVVSYFNAISSPISFNFPAFFKGLIVRVVVK